jgi:hypothetical protein
MSLNSEPVERRPRNDGDQIMKLAGYSIYALLGMAATTSLLFAPGELLIAVVGMVPAAVALFWDRSPGRRTAQCVAAMNFAGVSAIMALAWDNGGSLAAAAELLTNAYVWLVMLLGAAMGWVIVWLARMVAARVVIGVIGHQVAQLKEQQNELVKAWGRRVLDED